MIEILRVTSTILILWGTYTVVWKELEDQFSPRQQGIWWFAARSLLFIVTLMAIFYVVLGVALSVVWLEFFSLNAIADIAGKRNDFELAMTAFFLLFGLLTLAEATVAWFHAFRIHGQVQRVGPFLSLVWISHDLERPVANESTGLDPFFHVVGGTVPLCTVNFGACHCQ